MHLQELPQYVAIDIQEALEERFMESEAMYVRFLRKLLTSDDYKLMEEAAEAGNLQEVLLCAQPEGRVRNVGADRLAGAVCRYCKPAAQRGLYFAAAAGEAGCGEE